MRRPRSNPILALGVLLSVWLVAVPSAFAYIDPGTGSYIFQAIVGGLLAAAFAVKIFWRRIWGFLTGRSKGRAAPEPVDPAAGDE